MTDFKIEPIEATISELKPGMKSVNITFKVMSTGDERSVESRSDGQTHRVLDAQVGDSTATILMPFWNETIDELKAGETYTLTNGYVGIFRGSLRLQSGKFGSIESAENGIDEVNETLDMSAEEHSR
ncbi:single-stranded DNA-binding protein [Candidatus Thorarchaeota archaeon]|jgi:ssDNA-binding replication factor A large subunit|nr:MAG: single-stranded DNA-binding protein [Candidatus Thorarchaeota archaeon]